MCPRGEVLPCFERETPRGFFTTCSTNFKTADLSIANLECPLTDVDSPIPKSGPALRASPACIAGLKNAGIHVLNMANNHILDHGAQGVESTLRLAESAGMAAVGAGRNREEVRRILIRTVDGIRIGILGVAEHEFSIAGDASAGANPLDLIDMVRSLAAHRKEWDHLIVLLHGGKEGYPYPSPRLMETCRFLVEQGAGAVICQHSHCVGCYEEYRGGHIVYGQGNFVFESPSPPPGWNEGVLVQLLADGKKTAMELIPLVQSRDGIGGAEDGRKFGRFFSPGSCRPISTDSGPRLCAAAMAAVLCGMGACRLEHAVGTRPPPAPLEWPGPCRPAPLSAGCIAEGGEPGPLRGAPRRL